MEEDVWSYVRNSTFCSQHKPFHQTPVGLLQPLPVPGRPWSHISLDLVIGLPCSEGNSLILTITDKFSKMVYFVSLQKLPSAKETAQYLIQHVFRPHRLPMNVVSDRESKG